MGLSSPNKVEHQNIFELPLATTQIMYIMPTWNPKCPIFLGNKLPLKPATIALKIGHLAFQENISSPPPKKKINTTEPTSGSLD